MRMPPAESRLRSAIVKALSAYSGYWIVTHQAGTQEKGLPDIIGCYAGKFFGLEVKMPGRRHTLTERQEYVLEKIRKAGGVAVVVSSVGEAYDLVFGSPP